MAQFLDGDVETFVKIDEPVGGPQFSSQLLARDNFAGPLQQRVFMDTAQGVDLPLCRPCVAAAAWGLSRSGTNFTRTNRPFAQCTVRPGFMSLFYPFT